MVSRWANYWAEMKKLRMVYVSCNLGRSLSSQRNGLIRDHRVPHFNFQLLNSIKLLTNKTFAAEFCRASPSYLLADDGM